MDDDRAVEVARQAMVTMLKDHFDTPLGELKVPLMREAVRAGVRAYQAYEEGMAVVRATRDRG